MIKTLTNIFKVTATEKVNRFIYYFKRIPLIGKILPDSIYCDGALKLVISAVIYVFITSFLFLKKAFYLGTFVVLPIMWMQELIIPQQWANAGIQILFVLNFVIGSLQDPVPLRKDAEKYCCVKHLRMRASDYCVALFVYENALFFITFLPWFLLLSLVAKFPIYKGIFLLVMLLGARAIGTALHMALFAKIKRVIHIKWWFYVVLYAFVIAAYLPIGLGYIFNWAAYFVNTPMLLCYLAAGGVSIWYLFRYRYYTEAFRETISANELKVDKKQIQKEAVFANVKLKDSDLELKKEHLDSINRKQGYEYLNALFFQRHRRLLWKPVLIRLAIIAAAFVCGGVAVFFGFDGIKDIAKFINIFVFVMYCVSIGDKMAKSMFYNCDISLLRYSFYRERNVILRNFWIRLKKCIWYNLIPAFAMCAAIEGLRWMSKAPMDYATMIPFYCSVFCLSVFFSVHHLFLYYVFQPYTTELDVKNPFFRMINSAIYIVSYICLQLDSVPTAFVWGVLLATVLYIAVALILVYQCAPKMFRVK